MSALFAGVRLLLVTLLICFLFAQFVRRRSLFWPAKYPDGEWNARYATTPEDVTFTTSDDLRLHGWLFQSAAPRSLMIWFHGNGGNLTDRAEYAAEFAQRGISVLLFDYRGYGKSDGAPSERGLYRDAEAAYDFARAHVSSSLPIALYGESLGGPYAAWVAKTRGGSSVVIENSFPTLTTIGNAVYHPVPLGIFVYGALDTVGSLNASGLPVLVMHGKNDRVIPFGVGMKLHEGLKGPKELLVSDAAGHCEIPQVERDRYFATVASFVLRHARESR